MSLPAGWPAIRPIHPFPARMAPLLAMKELCSSGQKLRVLDPMAGSGTTLIVAKMYGHEAHGFDVDPLAIILARGWCSNIEPSRFMRAAENVLRSAKVVEKALRAVDAFPIKADRETKRFIRYWFDATNRKQLFALSTVIRRQRDQEMRELLWCAFSRMIIAKTSSVSLAIDVPHSRPRRVRERSESKAFERFLPSASSLVAASSSIDKSGRGSAEVHRGDARALPIAQGSIDLVVTSPPYLNAIDYLRCSKFSLVWMGHSVVDLRYTRATSIGTEVGLRDTTTSDLDVVQRAATGAGVLPATEYAMLRRFVHDMNGVLSETARVLKEGGRATFVVGNSTLRGTFVKNSEAVRLLGMRHGLTFVSARSRRLPDNLRYMPPPSSRNGFEARMRTEVVVRFKKPMQPG